MSDHRFVDLKRLVLPEAIYFVTVKTKNNCPCFRERIFCDLFLEELKWRKRINGFKLFAWFLGYDHVHLLVQPNDEWNISDVMHCLKRHISRNSNIVLGYTPFPVGADGHPRLPTGNGFDVSGGINNSQMGKKMDIFVIRQRIKFIIKYDNPHPFPKFRWQKSFYDRRVRNDRELDRKWEYVRWNPTKHNMPMGWPYVFTNKKFKTLIDLSFDNPGHPNNLNNRNNPNFYAIENFEC
jgi:REP element-mobilizing transposase RayT